jgi:thioredoxin 1
MTDDAREARWEGTDVAMNTEDAAQEPTRSDVDALPGPVVVEFGTGWCGHCQAAQPHLAAALERYPQVRHLKVEDGKGRPLGRSFAVKLWPTFVFLLDGQVKHKAVRPEPEEIAEGLQSIAGPAA